MKSLWWRITALRRHLTFTALITSEEGERGGEAVCYEGTLSGGQRICVAVWKEGFNYSALNNFGVSHAKGEYLVLMNNDIEMITEDWLEEMLSTCQRREVGVVGAKLYYPDDTVQHAGIVVGIGGNARGIGQNMFMDWQRARSGYLHKASLCDGLLGGHGGMPDGKAEYLRGGGRI